MLSDQKKGSYFVDHIQCAFKNGIKDLRNLSCNVAAQFVYDGCHGAEHFRLSGRRDVPLVIYQDGVQQRWNKVLPDLRTHMHRGLKDEHKNGGETVCVCGNRLS